MTIKPLLLAAISTSLGILSACMGPMEPLPNAPDAGQSSDAPITATTARELFDATIYPVVRMKCAGCHGASAAQSGITFFVDPTPAGAYDRLTKITALVGDFTLTGAGIVSKIEGGHQGTSYTSAELAKFDAWLARERLERGLDTTGGTDAGMPVDLLAKFQGCMTRGDFDTANMADTWGNLVATNNQRCKECHVTGGEGFIASNDAAFFFNVLKTNKAYLAQYFAVNPTAMPKAVDVNRASVEAVATRTPPHTEHPTFDPAPGFAASQQFLTLTNAHCP